jgi:molybdate transport system substrate-binding protein
LRRGPSGSRGRFSAKGAKEEIRRFESMKLRFFLITILLFAACRSEPAGPFSSRPDEGRLTVSAAVSLKSAFDQIGELYRARTGQRVDFNYGASGTLQRQIETGAPSDLFASAGERQMDELAAKNLIEPETRRDFARNTLVLIVPADSPLNLKTFNDLAGPAVGKIAIGNPRTVPAGQYTAEVFARLDLQTAVQPKLILAEDVRQVLDYVARGETDAGIVYATDALSAAEKVRVAATAGTGAHAPIRYPLAVVRESARKEAAQQFIDLVLGAEGQAVLKKYGFAAPEK